MRRIAVLVAALSFCVAGGQARATTEGSCDVAEARAVLNAYLVAFKRGQYADLQALFATKPDSSGTRSRLRSGVPDRERRIA